MFRKAGKHVNGSGITLIATNCELVGDVYFTDQLQVNGTVKGNIYAEDGSGASVTVSEQGRVTGEIKVPKAVINGQVCGDIHSDEHVELHEKAVIEGNVYYNLIEMVIGSQVDGNLVHVAGKKTDSGSNVSPLATTATTSTSTKSPSSSATSSNSSKNSTNG